MEEVVVGLGLFVEDSGFVFARLAKSDLLKVGRSGDLQHTAT